VARKGCAGGEADLGNADTILDEENFLGRRVGWRVVGAGRMLVVAKKFDGDVAERLVGEIPREMRETSHEEAGVAVLKFELDGRFACYRVFDFGVAQSHEDVVVFVAMDQSLGMRWYFYFEDADVFVF